MKRTNSAELVLLFKLSNVQEAAGRNDAHPPFQSRLPLGSIYEFFPVMT